jgi:hypothetical protein
LAAFLAIVGFALCLWAVYQYLMTTTDAATAALLTGMLSITLVGALIWLAGRGETAPAPYGAQCGVFGLGAAQATAGSRTRTGSRGDPRQLAAYARSDYPDPDPNNLIPVVAEHAPRE